MSLPSRFRWTEGSGEVSFNGPELTSLRAFAQVTDYRSDCTRPSPLCSEKYQNLSIKRRTRSLHRLLSHSDSIFQLHSIAKHIRHAQTQPHIPLNPTAITMFTKTLVILFNILFALTLAAPSPHNTNTTTAISSSFPNLTPRDCNPNGYGCSECSECCLLTYTSSKELGCGALGDPQQPLYGVAKPDGGCQNLFIGMYAAKVGECTGFFDSCVLW
ncbi:uncharacterized protein HMPREF1541_07157 [Cyphellophora europaea CBS 101466]|uniref:Uncharacterized protein n=1 Tax=Cyphellophora europaea (strain CBS 101466) TaxID=1220924 RepID=W2RMI8_CYPE1|nr:uncharacterized protein HMPREF1541_07157 [Cyphellophora europaea CBS 101466]ETN37535.1 hypothetical protein HMPREF1541_07157 [Cyphellophora europaea CBS 101466]